MDFKRALIRPQKSLYYKPVRHLFKAKRAYVRFESHENSLQNIGQNGNKLFVDDGEIWKRQAKYLLVFSIYLL